MACASWRASPRYEPQAGAAKAAGDGAVGLAEGFEQAFHLLRRHANAGVLHFAAQQQVVPVLLNHAQARTTSPWWVNLMALCT